MGYSPGSTPAEVRNGALDAVVGSTNRTARDGNHGVAPGASVGSLVGFDVGSLLASLLRIEILSLN